jgi:ribonuclease P protein component
LFRFDAFCTVRPPSLKASDFHRALGTRPVSRTAHFALHALPHKAPAAAELSTAHGEDAPMGVDDCTDATEASGVHAWRLGLVLPKKQARRSVTRSLLRHQIRESLRRHAPGVRAAGRHGDEVDGWVVRLKAPFDRQQFPSAASAALGAAVRAELDELWARLSRPVQPGSGT